MDSDLPFSACESPLLQCIIRGIKRYMGERDRNPKMPITCAILKQLLDTSIHASLLGCLNFEASVTTAFVGFLRCGEFTMQSPRAFDPSISITRSCVQFCPSLESPSYIILTVPSSKTDPFRKGMAITIASAPGVRTCAVYALKGLFQYDPHPQESPLFTQDDGAPLSWGHFISKVL